MIDPADPQTTMLYRDWEGRPEAKPTIPFAGATTVRKDPAKLPALPCPRSSKGEHDYRSTLRRPGKRQAPMDRVFVCCSRCGYFFWANA